MQTIDIAEIGTRLAMRANQSARNRGIDPARFVLDLARAQFLAAVGRVADEGSVALKGSALVLLDPAMSEWARPSKDLDLHLHGVTVDDLRSLFVRAAAELETVGIRIEWGARKPLWKPDGSQGGEKAKIVARLGKTEARFEVDAWIGGQRSPGMRLVERPAALDGLPPLRMLTYPMEAMVADKLHAIAQFGHDNTRIKDFYDILQIARRGLDEDLLAECVAVTFGNNGRALPPTPVLLPGLSRSFGRTRQDAWTKLLADAGRTGAAPADFVAVVDEVRALANRAFGPRPAPRARHDAQDVVPAPRLRAYA